MTSRRELSPEAHMREMRVLNFVTAATAMGATADQGSPMITAVIISIGTVLVAYRHVLDLVILALFIWMMGCKDDLRGEEIMQLLRELIRSRDSLE